MYVYYMCITVYIYTYLIYVCRDLWWNSPSLNECIELYTQIPECSIRLKLCKCTTRLDEKIEANRPFSCLCAWGGWCRFLWSWAEFFFFTRKKISGFQKSICWRKSQVHSDGELDGTSLFVYNNRVLYFFHVNNSTICHWLGIDTNYSLGFRNFPGSLKKKWEKAEWAHLCTKLPILVMFGTRKVFRVNTKFFTAKSSRSWRRRLCPRLQLHSKLHGLSRAGVSQIDQSKLKGSIGRTVYFLLPTFYLK